MTISNVIFLFWAAFILTAAWFFWNRGQRFAPILMVIGAILITISQLLAFYARGNPHGG